MALTPPRPRVRRYQRRGMRWRCLGLAVLSPLLAGAADRPTTIAGLQDWRARAEAGDPAAALHLGLLYDLGVNGRRDPEASLHWYERAAQGGLVEAEFNLAVLYDSGEGTPRNAALAAMWYARAAARGLGRAQYNLAQLYDTGDGVPKNADQAAIWFRAAQLAGITAAGRQLALLRHVPGAAGPGIAAPTLLSPAGGTTIGHRHGEAHDSAELVWAAPPQPAPTHFYVTVVALKPAGMSDVFAGYVDRSATLVDLPGAGDYAWRVFAVTPTRASYAPSAWAQFTID